jgi:hypothetical protein
MMFVFKRGQHLLVQKKSGWSKKHVSTILISGEEEGAGTYGYS